ncbi:MAG TPA: crossover junction endodeoxyribonuclease RuvC [Patescibacteria group bacterium]|nr:crossover junction endodeoxyribonuclease RuvC [Patescibacteria group bacterium]
MKILGIDPGTATTGWGVIKFESGKFKVEGCGCIFTPAKQNQAIRLAHIYSELVKIIKKEKPDVVAIEKLFFINNIKTAMTVGEARGVCLLVAEQSRVKIFEYTPLQVKQSLTGYGKAEKSQIQMMVKMILKLKEIPKPDDMADALAIAITHAHCCGASGFKEKKY